MDAGSRVLRGEMDWVASVAQKISRLDELQETMAWLRRGIAHVQAAGEARALTALLVACRPLETRAQQIANVRLAAGQALQRYSGQVASMQFEARMFMSRRLDAEAERARTENRIADPDFWGDAVVGQAHPLQQNIEEIDASLRMIEQRLSELDHQRSRADADCAAAIHACTADLNRLCGASGAGGAGGATGGAQTVGFRAPELPPVDIFTIALMSPEQVGDWWKRLSQVERDRLQQQYSLFVGNLDGVPFEDRIEASAVTAKRYIDDDGISAAEKQYWQQVIDGEVQLVVLDKQRYRIVEMLGDIGPETSQVITYVPGTTTRLEDFANGDAKRVPVHLEEQYSDAIIFVYKDFPSIGWADNLDEAGLVRRGENLARFGADAIGTDPRISDLPQAAVGYSAGMTVVAASEMHGAAFDQVVSLGGSYVPDGWTPRSGTEYSDIRYDGDLLNALDEYPQFEGLNTIHGMPEIFTPFHPDSPIPGESRPDKHGRLGKGPEANEPALDLLVDELKLEQP